MGVGGGVGNGRGMVGWGEGGGSPSLETGNSAGRGAHSLINSRDDFSERTQRILSGFCFRP